MRKLFLICILFAMAWPAAAQTLKGTVYYDLGKSRTKAAAGLVVYLVPDNNENKTIIRESSSYEPSCNERKLKSAKGYKRAVSNGDGYFYFTNIKKGKYFFKICTSYGGYYTVNISSTFTGTIKLPKFEADPTR